MPVQLLALSYERAGAPITPPIDLSSLTKALNSLERAVERATAAPADEELRDAVIQRFEYSYELSWKMLKRVLSSPPSERASMLDVDARHLELVLAILEAQAPGYDVWLFGSRATGSAKPYSDLDLALEGAEPLSTQRLAKLDEAFRESDLPFKVDLVDLASVSEAFAARIAAQKLRLPRE